MSKAQSTKPAGTINGQQPAPEESAKGAWVLVGLIVVMFLLFFGTTVAVFAAMYGWF